MLLQRGRTRAASGESVSDADPGIVERQLREFEPLDEVAAECRTTIRTDRPIEEEIVEVEELANRCLARASAALNSA
jgi:hypothetical protein